MYHDQIIFTAAGIYLIDQGQNLTVVRVIHLDFLYSYILILLARIQHLINMQKYHGFDQLFYDYLFEKIIKDGGLRMQLIASELVKELQTGFEPKHPLNIYRKQYGNIFEALKAIKAKPYFILDSMVIRMKKPQEVRQLGIRKDLMQKYEQKLIQNRVKEIEIMKINNENECKVCGNVYNVNVNPPCGKGKHQPRY